jgi:hypothetical protein
MRHWITQISFIHVKITPDNSSAGKTRQAIRIKIQDCCSKHVNTTRAFR